MDDLIQRPDLIHRLQQFLGLRQSAVVPRLNEGVQAVVVMGDVREVGTEKVIERPCCGLAEVDDSPAGSHMVATLRNPVGSRVVLRTQSVEVTTSPAAVILQPISIANGNAGTFLRTREVPSAVPVAEIDFDILVPFPTRHYLIDNLRPMTVPWVIQPGFELRLDSLKSTATGLGVFLRFMFAWTESSVGAS